MHLSVAVSSRADVLPGQTGLACPLCAHHNPSGAKFCNQCGSPVHLRECPRCEAINDNVAPHCYKCAAVLATPAVGDPPEPPEAWTPPALQECPHCEAINDADATLCHRCEGPLGGFKAEAAKASPVPAPVIEQAMATPPAQPDAAIAGMSAAAEPATEPAAARARARPWYARRSALLAIPLVAAAGGAAVWFASADSAPPRVAPEALYVPAPPSASAKRTTAAISMHSRDAADAAAAARANPDAATRVRAGLIRGN